MIEHIAEGKVKIELAQVCGVETHTICLPEKEVGYFFYPVKDMIPLFPEKTLTYPQLSKLLPKYLRYHAGRLWVANDALKSLFILYGHREIEEEL